MVLVSDTQAWKALAAEAGSVEAGPHLRQLLQDAERNAAFTAEHSGILMDFSRQRLTPQSLQLLLDLAEQQQVKQKIAAMAAGDKINCTENRSVLHFALRAAPDDVYQSDGVNVVPAVHSVLQRIRAFSEQVRSGAWKGQNGDTLTDVVAIGIGGSYLGAEYVAEALRTDADAEAAASGRRLRFLANIDPVAVRRAVQGLNPATTLVVIISKTFTTAETMLNARTMRNWLTNVLGPDAVRKHMIAVSANVDGATSFGIDASNVFEFWDWVGGRYSVTSAVGLVPLALQFGFGVVQSFLEGARDIDQHFQTADLRRNLPVLLGLIGVWNSSFLKYPARALLPYSEALLRFAAHLQQVDMESNGKRVAVDGTVLDFAAGEVDFGEPGTNGQHSFYQLVHQGRIVPADFIGFVESQQPISLSGETVSNHDELMSNFFAQPDALALGKTTEQLRAENVPEHLIPHKTFDGNRPSTSLLLPKLTPFTAGQLLALYEHRTAVQGFIWGINSFDQWGVELGKVLGKKVRSYLHDARAGSASTTDFNSSTAEMLRRYLAA